MNKKPLVLVVEDIISVQEVIVEILNDCAEVIAVKSFNRARRAIIQHGTKIVGVTLDYNILLFENDRATAIGSDLVYYIRKGCGEIPIYAASAVASKEDEGSEYDYNAQLVALGCLPGGKQKAPLLLRDYIISREWV